MARLAHRLCLAVAVLLGTLASVPGPTRAVGFQWRVWEVRLDDDTVVYLVPSVHEVQQPGFRVPRIVQRLFRRADARYFESLSGAHARTWRRRDKRAHAALFAQQKALRKRINKTLRQLKITASLSSNALPGIAFGKLRARLFEWARRHAKLPSKRHPGVEQLLQRGRHGAVQGLEDPQDKRRWLSDGAWIGALEALARFLDDPRWRGSPDDLANAILTGDAPAAWHLYNPKDREPKMVQAILAMAAKPGVHVAVIGYLHFEGRGTLLRRLAEAGYPPVQVHAVPLPRSPQADPAARSALAPGSGLPALAAELPAEPPPSTAGEANRDVASSDPLQARLASDARDDNQPPPDSLLDDFGRMNPGGLPPPPPPGVESLPLDLRQAIENGDVTVEGQGDDSRDSLTLRISNNTGSWLHLGIAPGAQFTPASLNTQRMMVR